MKQIYTIGLIILTLTISQQTFPQKENAKGPLTGEQQIELSEGYSFVSSRIIAPDPDMLVVLESILNDNLDFVRNSQGQVLRKIGPNWINGIGDWIIEEGYLVKMFAGDSFIIEGDVIDPVTPIQLEAGFQFVSYFPETPMDALIAFETILGDDLDFIRNSQGEILRKIGPNWINGIGDCMPGEGYLVKMNADDILVYPFTYGEPCPGMPTVSDIDGNTYNTVQIGDQCWMKENLKTTTYQNGTSIPNVTSATRWSNLTTGAYVWYDNDISWKGPYGALYNWYATVDTNGLCPTCWHIPTNDEWTTLTDFIGGTGLPHGNELKSCRQVNSPLGGGCNTTEHPRWNEHNTQFGTDDYGFSGLPGGYRKSFGTFFSICSYGLWWSSTEDLSYFAWSRFLSYSDGYVAVDSYTKPSGFSVRCLRDSGGGPLPTVTTATITNITQTTATSGGNVFYNGGYPVTARGVCWSTNENPTLNDDYTTDGSGTGVFISEITGLTANTSYYVRAYATNSEGTAYGNQKTFLTDVVPCPGIPTVTYEGQVYNTVLIGNQCWLKENLNVGTMINGYSNMSNNGVIEKYCPYNDPALCEIYGGLYQWNEMMEYTTTPGVQGICPAGWHLPTDEEWTLLTDFLGGESVAGGKMKETGFEHWWSPNTGATNESGFTALPGGYRDLYGGVGNNDRYGYFWSSSEYYGAWQRVLYYDTDDIYRESYPKSYGLSSRCLQDSGGQLPTVTTATITNITQTTATSGGNVTNNGGSAVTARGVCWSTNGNPTLNDDYTTDGSGTGVFISEITGLTANTIYYVRAYATNSEGTAYGYQETFNTQSGEPCPGIPTVTYEGQVYNTVLIGNQCWFKENLNVGTMINSYENMSDDGVIEKYCYNNDPAYCETYGGLYQWNEMMEYTTIPGVQGICPAGWHLPTDEEWATLTDFLGGESVAGGKMKETGTTHWSSPNTGATNGSGFTALPGGYRYTTGSFSWLGSKGYFWSSSEFSTSFAWRRGLSYYNDDVTRYSSSKSYGLCSRCLQD
jgi:uncharacterized protein (TIGR02145 family)